MPCKGTCNDASLAFCCVPVSVSKSTNGLVSEERSRVGETATFLRRAMLFFDDLKRKRYPNASTLARACGCSRSTAVRTIDRLRYEFGVPIEYEEAQRGYYLTQDNFSLAVLPPSREELLALFLVVDCAQMLGHISIHEAVENLWIRIAAGRSDFQHDRIRERVSIDRDGSVRQSGVSLFSLIIMCCHDYVARIRYLSPWMSGDGVEYIGRFERVRVARGAIHLVFRCGDGKSVVLNAAFIGTIAVLTSEPAVVELVSAGSTPEEQWYSGGGSWSGTATEMLEVTIAAPASKYYATQVWHDAQEDSWEGNALIRCFPSVVSVELAARLLGLGRALVGVRPGWVLEQLHADISNLYRLSEEQRRRR
jgi:biotin operon repressor